jgi:hypothetical protein
MNPQKPAPAASRKAAAGTTQGPAAAAVTSTTRKPWIKKTPVEVVLEQIGKQEQRAAELREALAHEERELQKLQQARKVLEAQ